MHKLCSHSYALSDEKWKCFVLSITRDIISVAWFTCNLLQRSGNNPLHLIAHAQSRLHLHWPPSLQAAAPPKRSSSMLSGKCDTPDKANPWKWTRFVIWRPAHDMAASGYGHPKPQWRQPRGARSSGNVTSRGEEAHTKHFHSVPFPFLWRRFLQFKLGLVYAVFMNLTLVMIVNCAFWGPLRTMNGDSLCQLHKMHKWGRLHCESQLNAGELNGESWLWLYCRGFPHDILCCLNGSAALINHLTILT